MPESGLARRRHAGWGLTDCRSLFSLIRVPGTCGVGDIGDLRTKRVTHSAHRLLSQVMETSTVDFDALVRRDGDRLRRALVASYGPMVGEEATQAALSYGWEHWGRVSAMANPMGYLYRVGQTEARRQRPRPVGVDPARDAESAERYGFEPGLPNALEQLSDVQRAAVLLVHGHGYGLTEAADVLGVSISTVRNHLARGLAKLRAALGVDHVTV